MPTAHLSNPNPPINLKRYHYNYKMEATEKDQAVLESMLGVMATISRQHFKTIDKRYCRAIAWIVDGKGENHLLCTASIRGEGNKMHAEEILARALYNKYKHDPAVVKDGVINIKKMYVDIEPCDGKRYGMKHNCCSLFTEAGKAMKIDQKNINISLRASESVYWNAPLPAEGNSSRARTDDALHEACLLGCDFNETYTQIDTWQKCYIITNETNVSEINLKEIYASQLKENEITNPMISMYETLANLVYDGKAGEYLSDTTVNTLSELLHDKKDEHKEFWSVIKAVYRQSSFKELIKNLKLSPATINAIKEVQYYKNVIFPVITNQEIKPEKKLVEPAMKSEINILRKQFHSLCKGNNVEDFSIFLTELKKSPHYISALLGSEPGGFTPLMQIIHKGNIQILRMYLQTLKSCVMHSLITVEDYFKLLIQPNNDQFSPLHQTLIARENNDNALATEILLSYLLEFEQLTKGNQNYLEHYTRLLTTPNKLGFTPLLSALKAGNPKNVALYFAALDKVLDMKNESDKNTYITLLTAPNNKGFSPLHYALISENSANGHTLNLYLERLFSLKYKDILSDTRCEEILRHVNEQKFNVLHHAAMTGKLEVVQALVKFIHAFCPKRADVIIQELLTSKTIRGYVPSCPRNNVNSSQINAYLLALSKNPNDMPTDNRTAINTSTHSVKDGKMEVETTLKRKAIDVQEPVSPAKRSAVDTGLFKPISISKSEIKPVANDDGLGELKKDESVKKRIGN